MKLDMHVHTKYSKDSFLKIRTLRKVCNKLNIIPIVTDHDQIKGNLHFQSPILATEVSSKDGHIIGYFITDKIKKEMSAIETIEEIHSQGGLAAIAHPFDKIRRSSILNPEIIKKADIIEVFNSRVIHQRYNIRALEFAKINKKLMTVGSDGHFSYEIGKSYIEIEPFDSAKEFMKNLKKAKITTKPNSPFFGFATSIYRRTFGE